ncbi:MAG: hypothetical protein WA733_09540 [Methylocystis sp.]
MEEFYQLMAYLPSSFKNEKDGEYVAYLRDSFEQNYQNGKYQFAILSCHMLYMSFVYFSVWQIKNSRLADFKKSLIGFSKDDETSLLSASTPFAFWAINESRIFRFLKLIGCENEAIGKFTKLVQQRNDIAHSNGNIFYVDSSSADLKVREVLVQATAIQQCMTPVIHDCLRSFLLDSWNQNEREYHDSVDQIREVLIHAHFFSQKDIEACLDFDVGGLSDHEHFEEIKKLLEAFVEAYRQNES